MPAMESQMVTIDFVGGGNMAEALIVGLVKDPKYRIRFSDQSRERREYMGSKYPQVASFSDTSDMLGTGALPQVVIFAVKPQVLKTVVMETGDILRDNIQRMPLLLSIAAGIKASSILHWLPLAVPLIRLMPNTPALIGEGVIGCFAADALVTQEHRWLAESIFKTISKVIVWVDQEAQMDAVTALSGSGPAYFFLVMEAMQSAGEAIGLSAEDAKALTMQTCLGAARMALQSEDDLVTLRRKVTSPKGTTEAAIKVMEEKHIREVIHSGIFAAYQRSQELADELGH